MNSKVLAPEFYSPYKEGEKYYLVVSPEHYDSFAHVERKAIIALENNDNKEYERIYKTEIKPYLLANPDTYIHATEDEIKSWGGQLRHPQKSKYFSRNQ